jgi:hypothetical protein
MVGKAIIRATSSSYSSQRAVIEQLAEYREAVTEYEVAFDLAEREARRVRDSQFSETDLETFDGLVRQGQQAVDLVPHTPVGDLALGGRRGLVERDGEQLLRGREALALGLTELRVAHASRLSR